MDKDFESIRSKVLKLQALAERGEKGEAINARRLLDQLLAKYGVSLEEIVEAQEEKQPYTFNVKENGYGFTLFTQCYFNVTNEKRMSLNFTIMVVTTENKKKSKGFLSGLNQLRVGDYKIAVTEIKAALGINNRNSFYAYRDGKIEPKVTQAKAVEGVFNKYGITANIWDV